MITLYPILGSENKWHYALGKKILLYMVIEYFFSLGLPIVFSVCQVILLLIVPESPKYLLLKKNDSVGAEKGFFYSTFFFRLIF